jgi:hypothetical protein
VKFQTVELLAGLGFYFPNDLELGSRNDFFVISLRFPPIVKEYRKGLVLSLIRLLSFVSFGIKPLPKKQTQKRGN